LERLNIRSVFEVSNPLLKDLLGEVQALMAHSGAPIPSLLSIPRATVPLLGSIFASAADLFRREPWQKLNPGIVLSLQAVEEPHPRFVMLTAATESTRGLIIHDSLTTLRGSASRMKSHRRKSASSHLSLTFGLLSSLSFDDLDAVEEFNMQVAAPRAYPHISRLSADGSSQLPTIHDLFWLEAALPALVQYFNRDHSDAIHSASPSTEFIYTVRTLDGTAQVSLRIPAQTAERS